MKQSCANVPSNSNIWLPNSGNSTSPDFGMPDAAKCARAASCSAGQYFDGAACVSSPPGPGTSFTVPYTFTSTNYRADTRVAAEDYCRGQAPGTGSPGTALYNAAQQECQRLGLTWGGGGTSVTPYPGDANSCPGFSYSRWDSSSRRYCQLNSERKCDYNYPSYLTNGANYKYENCPATDGTTPPTTSAVCTAELTSLLGSGCRNAGNAWFSGDATRYVYPGSTVVNNCSTAYINGCSGNPPSTSGTLAAPTGLAYTSSGSTVTFTWYDNSVGESSYQVEQRSPGGSWTTAGTTGYGAGGTVSYTYPAYPSGTYEYRAKACGTSGCSAGSNIITITFPVTSSPITSTTDCSRYGSGWHTMGSAGNCFDSAMQNYRTASGTLYSCSSTPATGCTGTTPTSGSCGSLGYDWTVYGNYCLNGSRTQYAPLSSPSLSSVQSCTGNDSPVTGCTPPGGTSTGAAACSDGRDNDGDGLIDYPSDTGCYSASDTTEDVPGTTVGCTQYGSGWHTMGSDGSCFDPNMNNYRTVNGTLYSCSTTPATGCSTGTTSSTSCPSGYHSMTSSYCMSDSNSTVCQPLGGGATYTCPSGTTTSTTCPSGQYWYVPSSGGAGYCQSTSTTDCASGQYWNGTSCVSSTATSCPSGQYWSGSSCVKINIGMGLLA
ncbi:hypothetical protein HYW68_00905 [Candidatus Parcubacteria bacterium]|nr:hypothetical protein [Candidatus Parcubacteria bacterium]